MDINIEKRIRKGENPIDDRVRITNLGDLDLVYTVEEDVRWLRVNPVQSELDSEDSEVIDVFYTTSRLDIGDHKVSIRVSDPNAINSPRFIHVTISVVPLPFLLVTFTNPQGNQVVAETGSSIRLQDVQLDSQDGTELTIMNRGQLDLKIDSFDVSGSFVASNTPPDRIVPDDEFVLKLRNVLNFVGDYSGSVRFNTNDPDASQYEIEFKLRIVPAPRIFVEVNGSRANPNIPIGFGTVDVDEEQEEFEFRIGNEGEAPLEFSTIRISDTMTIDIEEEIRLEPFEVRVFNLVISFEEVGILTSEIEFLTNDNTQPNPTFVFEFNVIDPSEFFICSTDDDRPLVGRSSDNRFTGSPLKISFFKEDVQDDSDFQKTLIVKNPGGGEYTIKLDHKPPWIKSVEFEKDTMTPKSEVKMYIVFDREELIKSATDTAVEDDLMLSTDLDELHGWTIPMEVRVRPVFLAADGLSNFFVVNFDNDKLLRKPFRIVQANSPEDFFRSDSTLNDLKSEIDQIKTLGASSRYVVLFNIRINDNLKGDGENTSPFTDYLGGDLSMAPHVDTVWVPLVEYASDQDIAMELVLLETELDQDNVLSNAQLAQYCRDIAAKFEHIKLLYYNLGEETNNFQNEGARLKIMTRAIRESDKRHPIVVHNHIFNLSGISTSELLLKNPWYTVLNEPGFNGVMGQLEYMDETLEKIQNVPGGWIGGVTETGQDGTNGYIQKNSVLNDTTRRQMRHRAIWPGVFVGAGMGAYYSVNLDTNVSVNHADWSYFYGDGDACIDLLKKSGFDQIQSPHVRPFPDESRNLAYAHYEHIENEDGEITTEIRLIRVFLYLHTTGTTVDLARDVNEIFASRFTITNSQFKITMYNVQTAQTIQEIEFKNLPANNTINIPSTPDGSPEDCFVVLDFNR